MQRLASGDAPGGEARRATARYGTIPCLLGWNRAARGQARNLEPPMHTDAHRWAGVRQVRSQPEPYNRSRGAVPMRWAVSYPCASACICGSKFLACFLVCRTPPEGSPSTTCKPRARAPEPRATPGACSFERRQNSMHQFARRRVSPGLRRGSRTPCTNSGRQRVGAGLRHGGRTPCTNSPPIPSARVCDAVAGPHAPEDPGGTQCRGLGRNPRLAARWYDPMHLNSLDAAHRAARHRAIAGAQPRSAARGRATLAQ